MARAKVTSPDATFSVVALAQSAPLEVGARFTVLLQRNNLWAAVIDAAQLGPGPKGVIHPDGYMSRTGDGLQTLPAGSVYCTVSGSIATVKEIR